MCVFITFALHYHYRATGTFLRKLTLNFFSVPVHSVLYFHVLLMLLSQSDVYSILISKHFLGGFSLLRNYKLKSVADITLRTLHMLDFSFIQAVADIQFLLSLNQIQTTAHLTLNCFLLMYKCKWQIKKSWQLFHNVQ